MPVTAQGRGDKRAVGKNDFHGVGIKGQYINIAPQKDFVMIRNGIDNSVSSGVWHVY